MDNFKWWRTKKAKRVASVCGGISFLGIVIWFFGFHPFVSTDDARVAMTLVRLAPEAVGGRVEKVLVSEGDRVKKGAILVELDHRTPEALALRARAKAKLAQHELRRVEMLAKQNGAPQREVDKAQAEADIAEAELKQAEANLDNTFLKSPIDGMIVQKIAEIGNILEPGQVALTIADADNAWISANIEETAVGLVRAGQKVKISVDEGGSLLGTVLEVRQAAASQFALIPSENAAGNFTKLVQRIPIKIALAPHPEMPLRAGQSVEVRIRVR